MDPSILAEIKRETQKRRTFAIISHPDAGKTTLTEKLLLYSGILRTAGMVSGRKGRKSAASDWMSMEQERGISITTSAMQFLYKDHVINVLDTPGHQDFSEDTYRTLTAADSVIMVIDAAKGIEAQTLKLFDACRLRSIPVITFINKMDLPPRDPIDLMEEIENMLKIQCSPMNWPIGMGKEFQGLVDLINNKMVFYDKTSAGGSTMAKTEICELDVTEHPRLRDNQLLEVQENIELMKEAGNPFDQQEFLNGKLSPVFFGSAMNNFGVEPLFNSFIDLSPCPSNRMADGPNDQEVEVSIDKHGFSAFVFKLQANMNPKHRDCVAFFRIISGRYEKDMMVKHERLGKKVRLSRPHNLQINDRKTLEEAYPGDVIGVMNPGLFQIGDTISLKGGFNFKPLPLFQPELFATIRPKDLSKRKAIDKGLEQLVADGAIQIMWEYENKLASPYLAAVGKLQFEVLQYRLEFEYGVKTDLMPLPYTHSAWLEGDLKTFKKPSQAKFVKDRYERIMVVFNDKWEKNYAIKENPDHMLLDYA
jgi:peptide chain release factor 3